jgi:glycerophosphoryl diester phosphodiesterase
MQSALKLFLIFFAVIKAGVTMAQYIPKFDVQGHRGASGLAPENTIPSFIAALNNGVTTIEMDVVITSDSRVVVSHEPWMSSKICLGLDGEEFKKGDERKFNIFEMTYTEVALYDCGSKGNDDFPEQIKIRVSKPLLQDVIVAVEDHIRSYTQYEVDYNIEIKSTEAGDNKFHPSPEVFSDLVFNLVNQYLPLNRIVIQSFDIRVLKYWHQKYPQVRLALLVENLHSVSRNLTELGFSPSIYCPNHRLVSKQAISYLHDRKIRIIPWTVNDLNVIKKLKALGVDGVITDYPDRTLQLGLGVKKPTVGKSFQKSPVRN